ncbi:hypothetical protein [Nocardia sp. XZ_19_369]|uniref:hypothetical protein n=1 Tax=Nocardia sp. XZ_19_369 TaxID=2769487 RepID=UPI00188F832B|nr:hypothetical protein [Nocardia sp. XZ_19_369]
MTEQQFTFTLLPTEATVTDVLAHDFAESLQEELPDATITRIREDPLNQDFGATLAVILSAPAAISLANGISKWLARRSDAKLVMRRTDGDGKKIEVTVNGRLGRQQTEVLIRKFFDGEQS